MRITKHSDYALRVLIFLEAQPKDRLTTIAELSKIYDVSSHHIRVIVHKLGKLGYIKNIQGKGGGIMLAVDANDITIGDVIRHTENDFHIVECFNPATATSCSISGACNLEGVLNQALHAFLDTLDEYTLADITPNKASILKQLEFRKLPTHVRK